jgi:uncharacterized protein DUF6869
MQLPDARGDEVHPGVVATEPDPPRERIPYLSSDANALFDVVLDALRRAGDDDDQVMMIGAGALESLFHRGFEEALWPRIEEQARRDPVFRRALLTTWAYDSPMFARRKALLQELGESQAITVTFVAPPEGLPHTTGYSWRAFESNNSLGPVGDADPGFRRALLKRVATASAVEHRPTQVVSQPLVVKDEFADRIRQSFAPPALELAGLFFASGRGRTRCLNRVGGCTELVCGDMRHDRRLSG